MSRLTIMRSGVVALALAAGFAMAAPAFADVTTYKVNLVSSAEVPPNDSAGTGAVTVTYYSGTKKLTWQGTYSGLTGPTTAGHFHGPAEPGKNAGVVIPLMVGSSPFQGTADLTDAQASDLLAGRWYVNIHTDAHKGGEIRGQVVK
jgi:hypothetical protein